MSAALSVRPPFRIHQDPIANEHVRIRLTDNSQGKLLQLTIFDAMSFWKNFSEEDPKSVLYTYDRNSTSVGFFRSTRDNVYALQIHSEGGEVLTYFQLFNTAHPAIEIVVTAEREGKVRFDASFREITPEEFEDRMPVDN